MNIKPSVSWSRGTCTVVARCPVCGSEDSVQVVKDGHDFMIRAAEDLWQIWRCLGCASSYLNPRPDDASIPAAYRFDYITHVAPTVRVSPMGIRWSLVNGYLNERFGYRRTPSSKVGAPLIKLIPPLRKKLDYFGRHLTSARGRTLLDLGCGNGDFIARAVSLGWSAEGVDPDPDAIAICRESGLLVTEGSLADLRQRSPDRRWDVITLSHSIEHVTDPAALVHQVYQCLAEDGYTWIALPNPESMGARFFGRYWESYDAPRHLSLPSQNQLKRILADVGFSTIKLVKRGSHAGRIYRSSANLALAAGERSWRFRKSVINCLTVVADLLATWSTRYAEETVIVAWKSDNSDHDPGPREESH